MVRKAWLGLGVLAVLALAACGQSQDSTPIAPQPPADAPAAAPQSPPALKPAIPAPAPTAIDPARPLNALGTDPFWALQIRAANLNFSTQETPMRRAANNGHKLEGGVARWTTTLPGGAALKVTLEIKPCANGLGDHHYPFTAEVETGGKQLKGCATYADDPAATP